MGKSDAGKSRSSAARWRSQRRIGDVWKQCTRIMSGDGNRRFPGRPKSHLLRGAYTVRRLPVSPSHAFDDVHGRIEYHDARPRTCIAAVRTTDRRNRIRSNFVNRIVRRVEKLRMWTATANLTLSGLVHSFRIYFLRNFVATASGRGSGL